MQLILWVMAAAAVLIAALLLIFIIWLLVSPMPAVKLLRRKLAAQLDYPPNYDTTRQRVKLLKNLTYPSANKRNKLDLYLPKNADKPVPVIMWAHGGAFVAGNKDGVENWATCLAAEGVAVAAVEYELAPEASWPAQVLQLCECCRYLSETAEENGLDISRFIIAGDSAGAHMAAQFALLHTSPDFCAQSGLKGVLPSGALKAALLYCGPYDISLMARPKKRLMRYIMSCVGWSYLGKKHWQNTKQARLTTIKSYVTSAFPPVYITDGNAYSFEEQGRAIVNELKKENVLVESRFFEKENGEVTHEYQFSMSQANAMLSYNDTVRFLKQLNLL